MKIDRITYILVLAAAVLAPARMSAQASALSQAREILTSVKSELTPDSRQAINEITARADGSRLIIEGTTSEAVAAETVSERLHAAGIVFTDSIKVYPSDKWALVRISAASLRGAGRHSAEMVTQAVMGTPLRVLDATGEFWRVQTPDGYIAYVPSSSVVSKSAEEMQQWRSAKRYIVTSPYQIRAYDSPTAEGVRSVVSDLVNGCIVEAADARPNVESGRLHAKLPDGRTGYIELDDLKPITVWAAQDFDPELILDTAYSTEGTPYLWGGTSTKAMDCSGLVKISYFANGLILMRDASQQAKTGTRIEAADWRNCQAGDLLFFGRRDGRVTHVAIYDHDGNYVHSSGRVKRNSVDPESDSYLTTPFLHAVRIAGNEGTRGITRARDHAWYFNL